MGLDTPETCRCGRNILRISCASSWFSLHDCIEIHGQPNIKFDFKKLKNVEGKLADNNCMVFLKSLKNISVDADIKNARTHMWKRVGR